MCTKVCLVLKISTLKFQVFHMYKNPIKSYDVCIKNRHASEKTCTSRSVAYGVCFYKIQGRQNSQVSRITSSQDNARVPAVG